MKITEDLRNILSKLDNNEIDAIKNYFLEGITYFLDKECSELYPQLTGKNKYGVDLSILNNEDWFVVEFEGDEKWLSKRNIIENPEDYKDGIHYCIIPDDYLTIENGHLGTRNEITSLRKATYKEVENLISKYPDKISYDEMGSLKEEEEDYTTLLNDTDWFYIKTNTSTWIARGGILKIDKNSNQIPLHFHVNNMTLYCSEPPLCEETDIVSLRLATEEEIERVYKLYPMYSPIKVGDYGFFYNNLDKDLYEKIDSNFFINPLREKVQNTQGIMYSNGTSYYKNFFKVSHKETMQQALERFKYVMRFKIN